MASCEPLEQWLGREACSLKIAKKSGDLQVDEGHGNLVERRFPMIKCSLLEGHLVYALINGKLSCLPTQIYTTKRLHEGHLGLI